MERTESEQPKEQSKEQPKEHKEIKHSLPSATIKRILRENGVERITQDALDEVAMMLQDVIRDIAINSVVFTKHGKRKTTSKEDILLALK